MLGRIEILMAQYGLISGKGGREPEHPDKMKIQQLEDQIRSLEAQVEELSALRDDIDSENRSRSDDNERLRIIINEQLASIDLLTSRADEQELTNESRPRHRNLTQRDLLHRLHPSWKASARIDDRHGHEGAPPDGRFGGV